MEILGICRNMSSQSLDICKWDFINVIVATVTAAISLTLTIFLLATYKKR